MAGKVRVHELAKELGVSNKDILARLSEQGDFVKSASSIVEASVARRLRESFGSKPVAGATSTREHLIGPRQSGTTEGAVAIDPHDGPRTGHLPVAPPRGTEPAVASGQLTEVRLVALLVDRRSVALLKDRPALHMVTTACGLTDADVVEIHAIGATGYTLMPAAPEFSTISFESLHTPDPGPRAPDDTGRAAAAILQSQALIQADGYGHSTVIVSLLRDHDGSTAFQRLGTVITVSPPIDPSTVDGELVIEDVLFFPPLTSWLARGVVRSCDDERAIIDITDAAEDGMWPQDAIRVGAETRAHAPIAPGEEVYLATEATGTINPVFRVIPCSSDLIVLSMAFIRPNRPPLRLSFHGNQKVTGRDVFDSDDPAVGGMWGMRGGEISFMTNADFNSYELTQCDDTSLVMATTNDVVSGADEEAFAIRLPTAPFDLSPVGMWIKATSFGNVFLTALFEDGETNEQHAFECDDDSVWSGSWQREFGGGCQLNTGPYEAHMLWSGSGFLAGHESWPDGTLHALEMYRLE